MEQLFEEKHVPIKAFSVLHVDGDMLMRMILKKAFSNHLFQLDSAANGREAFFLLERKKYAYDVVITEMHMHYANGYEIVNQIMRHSPKSKVIITSNMSFFHICEGLNLAKENYFKKPLVIGKLTERISAILTPESSIADTLSYEDLSTGPQRTDNPLLIDSDIAILQTDHIGIQLINVPPVMPVTDNENIAFQDEMVQIQETVQPQSWQLQAEENELIAEGILVDFSIDETNLQIPREQVTSVLNTGKRWW